jgi:hypothetical protein
MQEFIDKHAELVQLHEDFVDRIRKETDDLRAEAIFILYEFKSNHMTDELIVLANKYTINDADIIQDRANWTNVYDISSYNYYTQGMGARKYARSDAETQADKFRACNIPVEVIETNVSIDNAKYDVFAACSQDLATLIMYFKTIDASMLIANQIKRGTNPRVYWPFMPDGAEKALGIDEFGNKLE